MKTEDRKQEFPKMPETMRQMIEEEVKKQLEKPEVLPMNRKVRRSMPKKRLALAVAAATLALGMTVFAGVLYSLKNNQLGKYAYETRQERQDGGTDSQVDSEGTEHYVKIQASYLPEGMVQTEEGKYSFREQPGLGGVTLGCYYMDTGDTSFSVENYNVVEKEEIKINGRDGVYLKTALDGYNQKLYVTYPEEHLVLEMQVSPEISKEEAKRIAQGIMVTPVEESSGEDVMLCYNWSDYQKAEEQNARAEEGDSELGMTFQGKLLDKAKKVGDILDLEQNGLDETPGLTAQVTAVQLADNRDLLPDGMLDADAATAFDENGNLKSTLVSYVKAGDGVDTLDQVIRTEKVQQKLVYVTVTYTNTGKETLTNLMYTGRIHILEKEREEARIWYRELETPAAGDEWDYVTEDGLMLNPEVGAYDVSGGERNNNYIDSLKPGETVTIHEAFAVPADKVGELYFNLDNTGAVEEALEQGWMVDIRQ